MEINKLFDLTGKVAIVTGGGDGIGKASCEILSDAGASIVVSDIDLLKAQNVAEEIITKGGKAIAVSCNVLIDQDLVNVVQSAVKEFGSVNILVNNAGGGGGRENPFKVDIDYFEKIFKLNIFSAWRLCQLAVPYMAKSGYGSIINITSMGKIGRAHV